MGIKTTKTRTEENNEKYIKAMHLAMCLPIKIKKKS